jgi:hypothetical protein
VPHPLGNHNDQAHYRLDASAPPHVFPFTREPGAAELGSTHVSVYVKIRGQERERYSYWEGTSTLSLYVTPPKSLTRPFPDTRGSFPDLHVLLSAFLL